MIFYLHLFKTGGQTLATRLASAFPADRTHILRPTLKSGQHDADLRNIVASKDFVASHVSGPLLKDRAGLEIMTTIRNPIEQVISAYRHMKRAPLEWHRPAKMLTTAQFFQLYGDVMADHQSGSLIATMFDRPPEVLVQGHDRWLYERLPYAIDAIKWLVPTESIDEFVQLWSLERKIPVPDMTSVINSAPPDDTDTEALHAMLRERPELYAKDLYLWQKAREWFADYRLSVMASIVPMTQSRNSRCAFLSGESGVWCTKGWHNPIQSSVGTEFIAGPGIISELEIKRRGSERSLRFRIGMMIALIPRDMTFYRKRGLERLTAKIDERSGEHTTMTIPLDSFERDDTLLVSVPTSYSPLAFTDNESDPTRRPYTIYGVELI